MLQSDLGWSPGMEEALGQAAFPRETEPTGRVDTASPRLMTVQLTSYPLHDGANVMLSQ